MRKQVRDDAPEATLEAPHALELGPQERDEFRGQVDDPAVVILGSRPRIETQRPGLEVKLSALKRKNLALTAPPVGVLDRHGDLEILGSLARTARRLTLLALAWP
jgi:hypothetical protein